MSKSKLKIGSGEAHKDGVAFFPASMDYGIRAIRKEDGSIVTEESKFSFSEIVKIWKSQTKQQKISFIILLSLTLFWTRIVVLFHLPLFLYHLSLIYWILIMLALCDKISKDGNLAKYHGAEHKVFAWYSKYNTTPTIDDIAEIKKFSRINKHCGSNLLGTFLTFQIIASICMILFKFHISIFFIIILPLFLYNIPPFNLLGSYMQKYTTAEPNDEQLEVAITAMKETLEKIDAEKNLAAFAEWVLEKQSKEASITVETSDNCQND